MWSGQLCAWLGHCWDGFERVLREVQRVARLHVSPFPCACRGLEFPGTGIGRTRRRPVSEIPSTGNGRTRRFGDSRYRHGPHQEAKRSTYYLYTSQAKARGLGEDSGRCAQSVAFFALRGVPLGASGGGRVSDLSIWEAISGNRCGQLSASQLFPYFTVRVK